jgi:lipoprotein NlpD
MRRIGPARAGLPIALLAAALFAGGCASRAPAPVSQRPPPPEQSQPMPSAPAAKTAPSPVKPDTARGGAAVVERDTRPESHVVRKGDTLFSISLEYGLDYRDLAAWNRIENINLIRVGQTLRLRPPGAGLAAGQTAPVVPGAAGAAGAVTRPADPRTAGVVARALPPADPQAVRTEPRALRQPFSDKALAEAVAAAKRGGDIAAVRAEPSAAAAAPEPILPPKADVPAELPALAWSWPTSGAVIERFSDTNRGIDIGGKAGQPIVASADGRVVYSGSAIRGYGRMLIVKHNDQYVSVYAHASELLVKEGQSVSRGQRIAEMGSTDADRVKLHFEIRRMGRPIDPLRYLPAPGAS